jgi:uncharacterized protein YerC
MPPVSKRMLPVKTEEKLGKLLIASFTKAARKQDVSYFLSDLLTPTEQIMVAKRIAIAFLLIKGEHDHRQIADYLKVSTGTIARVNLVLKGRGGGYKKILEKIMKEEAFKSVLLSIYEGVTAVPPKGANWGEWRKERRKRRENVKTL